MNASGTTTSRRPRVTNAATGTTSSSTSTGYNIHTPNAESEDEPPRISRQRRRYLNSMLIVLSPSLIFSKILLISSMILRVGLFPFRKLAYWLFPPGSYDDIASSSASKHAAKVFIEMFHSEYIMKNQQQSSPLANNNNHHHNNNNNNGEIGNETTSADNDVDGNVMTECPFVENGYVDTIRDIGSRGQLHQQNADLNAPPPLLLIYLHAPLHDKVPHFLKNVLCNPRIMSLIHRYRNSGALTCWGGSIHTADGAYARDTLQVSCFPFLALVRVGNQNGSSSNARGSTTTATTTTTTRNLELLFRMEGPDLQSIQPNALFLHLNNALVKYEAILTEQTMRRLQRQEEVRLREEQDREYREALEADQKREREKQEQQRLKEEEERRIREEQERIAKEKQNRLDNARRILDRNGSGNSNGNGSGNGNGMQGQESLDDLENDDSNIIQARIRLVLPTGKRLERKFRGDDTIDVVRSFLILHFEENDIPIENFELSSNYPKKALTDGEKTLESEGLCPHAVIMVQDLDA